MQRERGGGRCEVFFGGTELLTAGRILAALRGKRSAATGLSALGASPVRAASVRWEARGGVVFLHRRLFVLYGASRVKNTGAV